MITTFSYVIAQATPTAQSSQPAAKPAAPGGLLASPVVMMIAMIGFMYVLMIRPQQKQRKAMMEKIAALKTGDKVITSSGTHGVIHKVNDTTVMVKFAENVILEVEKASIATVKSKNVPAPKTKDEVVVDAK